ncbi:L-serine ammonia-lyase, iron-sulfur-dependent subunit beta [Oceanotoga sp. DSM 15011]|jgi:L-serine dehydratase|uniref:L-serine dehydratase n=1 Tax=Oceanotoga teriensis TaxID=515440 RepID=A0AA45C4J3_9BACT|nr:MULTISPECIES: L-serine ammonia-lyase, iron-sulfur-dependent subunit beta [Oceanotoga]MDN5341884.1 L-serine dehydratase [Oceanotoga sp.]MDO7977835.1 L-serine ammonia-lyase, iron-sulfur-dependent subunit beta [Oceanotoga teriensis]PWJ85079.1 L-serine dehydratase [Oceanotoga teriensis]UYP00718.1 L-serine ammonia-lyase, iron-sulfur-dependent subunit beta [Oceanotoga sp. DSM 15011]
MSLLDVIGPIIIGPSSSHTAGAVKIGKFAHNYIGGTPDSVRFILHGSFADTYIGHGTDRALLGGIMGFEVDDHRIRNSYKIAQDTNMKYEFNFEDLGNVHPNTVKIIATKNDHDFEVIAASIGASEIVVNELDGTEVYLRGKVPTLAIVNKDIPGTLTRIMSTISKYNINVANVTLKRISKIIKEAVCILELDEEPTLLLLKELESFENIISCKYIPKI